MCLQDYQMAKKTAANLSDATVGNVALTGSATRLRVVVSVYKGVVVVRQGSLNAGPIICYVGSALQDVTSTDGEAQTLVMRLEDWGIVLLGPLFFSPATALAQYAVSEISAQPVLDRLISEGK